VITSVIDGNLANCKAREHPAVMKKGKSRRIGWLILQVFWVLACVYVLVRSLIYQNADAGVRVLHTASLGVSHEFGRNVGLCVAAQLDTI
jgi:hypothetical protein